MAPPHSHSHDHAAEAGSSNNHNNKNHHSASCANEGGHSHDHSHGSRALFVPSADTQSISANKNANDSRADHAQVLSDDELARRSAMKRLKIASALCVAFFCVEVVGGYLAGSLAVLSDAAHLFSDMASFIVAIFANYLAGLPSTTLHTFGLKRSESLAALFSMVSLALVCVWLGVEAVQRLYYMLVLPDVAAERYAVDGALMSGIASIGVLVNVALAWVLGAEGHVHMPGADHHGHSHSHDHGRGESSCSGHGHGHGHDHHNHHDEAPPTGASSAAAAAAASASHHHSHDDHDHLEEGTGASEQTSLLPPASPSRKYAVEHFNEVPPPPSLLADAPPPAAKARNVNLQAAYLHVLGDLAQSVAVLIAGVVIWFRPSWIVVDPLCTLGFCVLVFYSTLGVVRASMSVLLEEVPPQISWTAIYKDLAGISHLRDVHDLHIWCISDGVPSLSLHASCDDGKCEEALKSITAICKRYGIEHITAQVRRCPWSCCVSSFFRFQHRIATLSRHCPRLQVQPWVGDCITCENVVNNACFESAHES
jgi:solute carrier family 30 (zinc transporter), member 2